MNTTLTQPDTSTAIVRPQTIGTVHCISVNRPGQPQDLRYYGTSAVCGASGNAHPTQSQAEQDVRDWADGKAVSYVPQAVTPLSEIARYAPLFAAGVAATPARSYRPYELLAGLSLATVLLYFCRR
jgi:hypothetical protein